MYSQWFLTLDERSTLVGRAMAIFSIVAGCTLVLPPTNSLSDLYFGKTGEGRCQECRLKSSDGGSASSVALTGLGNSKTPVLALPAPDGIVRAVNQDPFAASLSIPPPSYVQMVEMEKKQHLLMQEQQLWQQYARDGMHG
ncbi:putative clathrin assembly protein [Cucumis melo var. makuwa]|uniref:Clathrin assembly protein n=1 Tax=Cucumis melo var. makuwa TaxID=1194695 RepID=A0A5A7U368_CUCMM|nr:putative clathrin assembly protein [Cucumis melo var. makuwa]